MALPAKESCVLICFSCYFTPQKGLQQKEKGGLRELFYSIACGWILAIFSFVPMVWSSTSCPSFPIFVQFHNNRSLLLKLRQCLFDWFIKATLLFLTSAPCIQTSGYVPHTIERILTILKEIIQNNILRNYSRYAFQHLYFLLGMFM